MAKTAIKTAMVGTIEEGKLYTIGKRRYKSYGDYVVTNRALADYRDGLKPVHRRILWGLHKMGLRPTGKYSKCSKIAGVVMGDYHPHGDAAIYDAMVGMVKALPIPLVDGQGNFGNWNDPPAAPRYTEARLTKYAAGSFLHSDYLDIIPMEKNYDGETTEPLFLPALMPNVLLNGTQGIALGVTGFIPPIHPDALMPWIERTIKGKKITAEILIKEIKFNWKDGANTCVSADADILSWLEKGSGALYFQPDYEFDETKRSITFTNVPPNFNWKATVDKVLRNKWIASCDDFS